MRYLLIALALLVNADKPRLTTRVFPAVQTVDLSNGCSEVLMTAEITGVESEEWYCPKVEWEFPNGTRATEESDCPPFEKRNECMEDQSHCGYVGWTLNPITGKIEDKVNECACTIIGYPRIWRRRICAPAHPQGETWAVIVRLSKNNQTLAKDEIHFYVK